MTTTAEQENARTLAAVAGVSQQHAAQLLSKEIAITCESNDRIAVACAEHIRLMLSRTVASVIVNGSSPRSVAEVVINGAEPRHEVAPIFIKTTGRERI